MQAKRNIRFDLAEAVNGYRSSLRKTFTMKIALLIVIMAAWPFEPKLRLSSNGEALTVSSINSVRDSAPSRERACFDRAFRSLNPYYQPGRLEGLSWDDISSNWVSRLHLRRSQRQQMLITLQSDLRAAEAALAEWHQNLQQIEIVSIRPVDNIIISFEAQVSNGTDFDIRSVLIGLSDEDIGSIGLGYIDPPLRPGGTAWVNVILTENEEDRFRNGVAEMAVLNYGTSSFSNYTTSVRPVNEGRRSVANAQAALNQAETELALARECGLVGR